MELVREFLLILLGAAAGCVLGAGFGALLAVVSPEFISLVTTPIPVGEPVRLGTALGLASGLFVGAACMILGRVVGALRLWATRSREALADRRLATFPEVERAAGPAPAGAAASHQYRRGD